MQVVSWQLLDHDMASHWQHAAKCLHRQWLCWYQQSSENDHWLQRPHLTTARHHNCLFTGHNKTVLTQYNNCYNNAALPLNRHRHKHFNGHCYFCQYCLTTLVFWCSLCIRPRPQVSQRTTFWYFYSEIVYWPDASPVKQLTVSKHRMDHFNM